MRCHHPPQGVARATGGRHVPRCCRLPAAGSRVPVEGVRTPWQHAEGRLVMQRHCQTRPMHPCLQQYAGGAWCRIPAAKGCCQHRARTFPPTAWTALNNARESCLQWARRVAQLRLAGCLRCFGVPSRHRWLCLAEASKPSPSSAAAASTRARTRKVVTRQQVGVWWAARGRCLRAHPHVETPGAWHGSHAATRGLQLQRTTAWMACGVALGRSPAVAWSEPARRGTPHPGIRTVPAPKAEAGKQRSWQPRAYSWWCHE